MAAPGGIGAPSWGEAQVGQPCGKYHVIAQLGRGGMADVYLAVARGPAGFNKLLVLKQLPPSRCAEPELLTMFLDEASLAARLNHPNVVQVNEIGRDGDKYFIAMEYLDGQPLVRLARRMQPEGLPLPVTLRIVADACAGLHYVHTLTDFDGTPLGAVHRDVSPHNLFVTYGGHVKLVDFGIAKAANRSAETQIGMLKGKITYMSPEQIHGMKVDARSDIFALGIVLYETLTRERLWGNQPQEVDIVRRLVKGDVPGSPREVDPDIPEDVDEICRRALAVDRDARYSSAREMQEDLEQVIARLPYRATEREVGDIVSQLFAEERRAIAGIIESQIRALAHAPDGELNSGSLPRLGVDGAISVTPAQLQALRHSEATIAAPPGDKPPKRRRAIAIGLGSAIAALLLILLWFTLFRDPREQAAAPPPPPPAVAANQAAGGPPPEAPRTETNAESGPDATPDQAPTSSPSATASSTRPPQLQVCSPQIARGAGPSSEATPGHDLGPLDLWSSRWS